VEYLLAIARDTTAEIEERARVEAIGAEMRHRLRNAMTIAGAIVTMAARDRPELQPFVHQVTSRFAQLGKAQELILAPSADKPFSRMMPLLASAYGNLSLEFGTLPDVKLNDRAMQALALVFGELATNSLKYGALKHGNRILVDGRLAGNEVELTWREETVFAGQREGAQGLTLIDRIVRASGGRIERAFGERHFTVSVVFPLAD
jgi:two-component sensor histidine kinase